MKDDKKKWARIASNQPVTEAMFLGGGLAQEPQSVLRRATAPTATEKEMAIALAISFSKKAYLALKARTTDYDLAAVAGLVLRKDEKGNDLAIMPEDLASLDKAKLNASVEVTNGAGEQVKRGIVSTARYNVALGLQRAAQRIIETARQQSGNATAKAALFRGVLAHKGVKGEAHKEEMRQFYSQWEVSVPLDIARAFVNKVLPEAPKPKGPSREQQRQEHFKTLAAAPTKSPEELLEEQLKAMTPPPPAA